MADIRAFRGVFYNERAVNDPSRVVAPPYDVIDQERKESLLSRSPYNIVRLILPHSPGDREFWRTSATLYRAWKRGDVLTPDSGQCMYAYRQSFELPGEGSVSRTGVVALLRCREFSSGEVLPHERTFPHTRAERLKLLRACRANFSQIFTVFRDEDEEVLSLLDGVVSSPAFMGFSDDEGVFHQLWRVEDGASMGRISSLLGARRLIIADGHHRYETALKYSQERHVATHPDHPGAYVSAMLFRSEDPGLTILPVHRLLRRMPSTAEDIHERLRRRFHVELIQEDPGDRRGMFREKLASSRRPAFVMITQAGASLLTLREGVDPAASMGGAESARWKGLDISILHGLVIGEGLGMQADVLAERGDLYFTPWESAALSALDRGDAEAAFLVRPTSMEDIWEIAERGERMPHKSSYFYPKLPSGLVIYDHDTALA